MANLPEGIERVRLDASAHGFAAIRARGNEDDTTFWLQPLSDDVLARMTVEWSNRALQLFCGPCYEYRQPLPGGGHFSWHGFVLHQRPAALDQSDGVDLFVSELLRERVFGSSHFFKRPEKLLEVRRGITLRNTLALRHALDYKTAHAADPYTAESFRWLLAPKMQLELWRKRRALAWVVEDEDPALPLGYLAEFTEGDTSVYGALRYTKQNIRAGTSRVTNADRVYTVLDKQFYTITVEIDRGFPNVFERAFRGTNERGITLLFGVELNRDQTAEYFARV
jgi:hypothetical protein